MARKKIIAGNWKMNETPSEALKLVETLKPLVNNPDVDVVYCVPAIDIVPVANAVKGTNVHVGAENMYFEEKGAYTGEICSNAPILSFVSMRNTFGAPGSTIVSLFILPVALMPNIPSGRTVTAFR